MPKRSNLEHDGRRARPLPMGKDRLEQLIKQPAFAIETDLRAGELLWLATTVLKKMEGEDDGA